MQVEIVTPDQVLFSGEADSVKLPGTAGKFETLSNHAPLISSLSEGKVIVGVKGDKHEFDIKGGIVEVLKDKIVVLV